MMNTWAEKLISFYHELKPPRRLPNGVQWLYPQQDPIVMEVVASFFHKYYNDHQSRTLMLGINPGRFGAGITGVNFTAPRQLTACCGIRHPFGNSSELSAEFIYDMIQSYGGVSKFYRDYFIGSVSPLGFVQNGKNINYYDDKELLQSVEKFIIQNLQKLVSFGVNTQTCYSIGGEKNYKYLTSLNSKHKWFQAIIPLPHPRFIMQYKRKEKEQFVMQYLHFLKKAR